VSATVSAIFLLSGHSVFDDDHDNYGASGNRRFLLPREDSIRCHCDSAAAAAAVAARTLSFSRNFVADAVEKVLPAVVRIQVHVKARDGETDYDQRGSGSGFFVSADEILYHETDDGDNNNNNNNNRSNNVVVVVGGGGGDRTNDNVLLVLTNAHCVLTPQEFKEGGHNQSSTKTVYLELSDDRVITGKIVAFDTQKDVALIRPDTVVRNVTAARLFLAKHDEDDDDCATGGVRHGEFVAAVGAPLELENTVTVGVVSNPRRRCRHDPGTTYIQTDNTCHVGNSGGPLVNMDGTCIPSFGLYFICSEMCN
jgi:S1-C subfamily serine protease